MQTENAVTLAALLAQHGMLGQIVATTESIGLAPQSASA